MQTQKLQLYSVWVSLINTADWKRQIKKEHLRHGSIYVKYKVGKSKAHFDIYLGETTM